MSTDMAALLTKRQAEFLAHYANGERTPQIAQRCVVSRVTVETTLRNAKDRLGARNLPQAVAFGIAYELLILHHDGSVLPADQRFLVAA